MGIDEIEHLENELLEGQKKGWEWTSKKSLKNVRR